ncbi:methyltransferase domain-containing protein [Patescibacteria group bacterium]|nr:methyltransferase domain-containing protein [Patescibacteria group bacterium]MDE1946804.1 class I SAM-dependent methyltransferase [Patescibacteria group bacterium]MDE2011142.1 class I SAM-dependent methyltransferase [Patescibacteria group bacterium]MDE2233051.1 class I SAM-dependent methyltransferase [Patescibacteria group bacterium]
MSEPTLAERVFTRNGVTTDNVVNGLTVIDIGSGGHKLPGSVGLDILQSFSPDILHDITIFPWPVKSGSFDAAVLSHVLEHVPDVIRTMNEVHRILKPGGRALIQVPYFRSIDSVTDPTHIHFFTSRSLDYICQGTKLSLRAYTKSFFRKERFWYGPPHNPTTGIGRLKKMLQKDNFFYDQYISVLLPAQTLTWQLISI